MTTMLPSLGPHASKRAKRAKRERVVSVPDQSDQSRCRMTMPSSSLHFITSTIILFSVVSVTSADQYKVAIPAFHLSLRPVTSDFNKKAAKQVLSVAEDVAQEYLTDQLENTDVKVEEVFFDLRSWSFNDKRRQRKLRGGHDDTHMNTGDLRREAECTVCTDVPTANMKRRGTSCPEAKEAVPKRCREDDYWVANRACAYSCWLEGRGYTDIKECCDPNAPPPVDTSNKKEVIIKSQKIMGGYVAFTVMSPESLPDQAELFTLLSSSLFPTDISFDIGEDNVENGLTNALNEQLGYSNKLTGAFSAVEAIQKGVSGLITESPTISPTTVSTTSPTAVPSAELETSAPTTESPTELDTFAPTWAPTESPTELDTFAPTWAPVVDASAPTRLPVVVTEAPSRSPTKNPTPAPSRRPTLGTPSPTIDALVQKEGIYGEDEITNSEDLGASGAEELKGSDAAEDNDTNLSKLPKATEEGESSSSDSKTALMAVAVVAALAIVLFGAFFVRRRRYRKEYDTSDTGGGTGSVTSSPPSTNINGDKSLQLRNFDALDTIDEGSLRDDYTYDDEVNTLDLSSDQEDIVADLVGCGADLVIDTRTPSKTNKALHLNLLTEGVEDDDHATAPLSPFSQVSSSPSSPMSAADSVTKDTPTSTLVSCDDSLDAAHKSSHAGGATMSSPPLSPGNAAVPVVEADNCIGSDDACIENLPFADRGDAPILVPITGAETGATGASPLERTTDELTMVEPKMMTSSIGLAFTAASKEANKSGAAISPPSAVAPLLPLDLDRISSLGKEVDFDDPTFKPDGCWDFMDNDADSTNSSSDVSSSHNPFVTPDTMPLNDQDSLIPPFPVGSPDSLGSRKAYVHDSNYDYNHDESSSAASILFTVLGRTKDWKSGKVASRAEVETGADTACTGTKDQVADCDDRYASRDWSETAML